MIHNRFFIVLTLCIVFTSLAFSQANLPRIEIINDDIELLVGESVTISVVYINENETEVDTTGMLFSVTPDSLGKFEGGNKFTAKNFGKGWIYAVLDSLFDSVKVEIEAIENNDSEYPRISIVPDEVELSVNDTISFTAYLEEDDSLKTEVIALWESENPELFAVSENGTLVALSSGLGKIKAVYDSLSSEVLVKVVNQDNQTPNRNAALCIIPSDTIISIGDEVTYSAYFKNDEGEPSELVTAELNWTLDGMPIGELSNEGVLSANEYGFAVVKAVLNDSTFGSAFVIVEGDTSDTETNSIVITKSRKNKKGYSTVKRIEEGERWVIGGMPSPMNMLNGGFLYFPKGSLHEDIRIHVEMPEFAKEEGDSVNFGQNKKILTGVSFHVIVNDTVVEPYYFDIPIISGIVFKHGLLKKYGIEPENLAMFFAEAVSDSVDLTDEGIENIVVDLAKNRIYGSIAHFSSIVVADKNSSITDFSNDNTVIKNYNLEQNYPNPFNPTTTIRFELANSTRVTLNVYNSLGQIVKTLVNEKLPSGKHSLIWNAKNLPSGAYFYRINADSFIETRKMILLK